MPSESVSRIEPAHLEKPPAKLADLAAELSAESAVLGRSLHPRTAAHLADLVRIMNTYYSNLMEGHNTRPHDIELALANQEDRDNERRRNLQLEARAHVRVQAEIDRMGSSGRLPEPASVDFIRWLHREFYRDLPEAMLQVTGTDRSFRMTPGEWRSSANHDVAVGRHVPPSSDRVDDFMRYFADRYRVDPLGKAGRLIAMAAAHHRMNYIHPFPDGNGRVSRLMSHAMAWRADIAAHGLWAISRGLARGLNKRADYKAYMDLADSPRQSDLDGRGNLSERALIEFATWFLEVALDQVKFMSKLFDLGTLSRRLRALVGELRLRPEAAALLEEALLRGEIDRGEASRITGLPERTARRALNDLVEHRLLASDTPKAAVSLRFPVETLDTLFPRLYAEGNVDAAEPLDETIRFAIENRRLLEITYGGRARVVEPHDYGTLQNVERLLVYQISGPTRPQQSPSGWRLLDVNKIQSATVLDRVFKGSRGDAHQAHHVWDIVYARVK